MDRINACYLRKLGVQRKTNKVFPSDVFSNLTLAANNQNRVILVLLNVLCCRFPSLMAGMIAIYQVSGLPLQVEDKIKH